MRLMSEPVTNLEKGSARLWNPSRTPRRDPRVSGTRHESREGTRVSLEPVMNLEKGPARPTPTPNPQKTRHTGRVHRNIL